MEIKRLNEAYDFSSLTAQPKEHLSEELLQEGPVWDYLKDKTKAAVSNSKLGQKIRDIKDPKAARNGENAEKEDEQRRGYLNKKAAHVIANDFRPVNANSKFYINQDYKKPMSQDAWKAWQKQQRDAADGDPEQMEKLDNIINDAIVLDREGYYMRRGAEDMSKKLIRFRAGDNDEVGGQYRSPDYKYRKTAQKPTSSAKASGDEETPPTGSSPSKSSGKELITKVTKLAVMTGMPIYSDEKCAVPLKKLNSTNFSTAYVKVKNKPVALTSWAASMKKEKLL